MASENEISEARTDAQLSILRKIKDKADKGLGDGCRDLAEAYAWLEWPNQHH